MMGGSELGSLRDWSWVIRQSLVPFFGQRTEVGSSWGQAKEASLLSCLQKYISDKCIRKITSWVWALGAEGCQENAWCLEVFEMLTWAGWESMRSFSSLASSALWTSLLFEGRSRRHCRIPAGKKGLGKSWAAEWGSTLLFPICLQHLYFIAKLFESLLV